MENRRKKKNDNVTVTVCAAGTFIYVQQYRGVDQFVYSIDPQTNGYIILYIIILHVYAAVFSSIRLRCFPPNFVKIRFILVNIIGLQPRCYYAGQASRLSRSRLTQ